MKRLALLAAIVVALGALFATKPLAADPPATPRWEYVTIRWAGLNDMHLIRPGGQVEFISEEVRKFPKPSRADNRSFYLNCAMNGLTKEGYEFVGISSDDVIMRRPAAR